MILLPLLWILRVSLTDKLTAYKIPPEIGTLGLDELRRRSSPTIPSPPGSSTASSWRSPPPPFRCRWRPPWPMPSPASRPAASGSAPRRAGQPDAAAHHPGAAAVRPVPGGRPDAKPPGLIIAHLTICLPFLAWMLVSFFEGDVARLEEAARVDGATRWQAFIKIAVPVAAPGLLAAGLLGFILSWNEFLFALVLSAARRPRPCRSASPASRPMPASRSRRSPRRPWFRCCRSSRCCRSCASI